MTDKPVGYLMNRPEPGDRGKYLLFITRPTAGMFGQSAGTAIFAIDQINVDKSKSVARAETEHGPIVFSLDMPFITIPRNLGTPVTTADLAKQQVQERKDWDAVMEAEEPAAATSAVGETPDGRMTHNPGQYL